MGCYCCIEVQEAGKPFCCNTKSASDGCHEVHEGFWCSLVIVHLDLISLYLFAFSVPLHQAGNSMVKSINSCARRVNLALSLGEVCSDLLDVSVHCLLQIWLTTTPWIQMIRCGSCHSCWGSLQAWLLSMLRLGWIERELPAMSLKRTGCFLVSCSRQKHHDIFLVHLRPAWRRAWDFTW